MRVMKAHGVKRILALSTAAFKVPQEQVRPLPFPSRSNCTPAPP